MKKLIYIVTYMLLLFLLIFPVSGWGETYFLRADGSGNKAAATGSGTGACDAAGTAMSIATHDGETYTAGDTIYLCDTGGVFRDRMDIPSSGSNGSPITYTAASGDTPIIGSALVTGWAVYDESTTYIAEDIGCDARSYNKTTMVVEGGDTQLTYNADKDALAAGEFYHNNTDDDLYVHLAGDADPSGTTIEADIHHTAVYATGKDYINMSGLTIRGQLYGLYLFRGNDYWNFTDNNLYYIGSHAIKMEGEGGAGNTYNTLEGNNIQYNGGSGLAEANPFAIRIDGASNNNTISKNRTQDIEWGSVFQTDSDSNVYQYNYFESDGSNAFTLTDSVGDGSDNNILYSNVIISNNGDYDVILAFWDASTGNIAYGNTIIGGADFGFDVGATATGSIFKNNIISNTTTAIRVANGGDVDFDSDYNVIYSTVRVGSWKGDNQASLNDWQTASGGDANSIASDPLLNADYTLAPNSPAQNTAVYIPGYTTKLQPTSSWPDAVLTMEDILPIGAYGVYRGAAGM